MNLEQQQWHPKIEQAIKKADEFLASYPALCQYDQLQELEKQTGQPKILFAVLFLAAFSSTIYLFGGMKLVSDFICFVYPAYVSLMAISSPDPADDTQWLTYWVVFAVFSIVESALGFIVVWIPFYFAIKVGFFMWLYHPKFMGAVLVYKEVITPFVMPHLQATEEKPQKKQE